MLNHYVDPEDRLSDKDMLELKQTLLELIQQELDSSPPTSSGEYQSAVKQLISKYYQEIEEQYPLSEYEEGIIFGEIQDELTGFGPIQPLLEDPDISEIMIYGPEQIYIERNGKLEDTDVMFDDEDHIMRMITRILSPLGRRVDQDNLMADARLPDGSRVNIAIPPVSIDGPSITIRKFLESKLTIQQIIDLNTLTEHMAEFLEACVAARLNILITGNTSSGKTTLLNIMAGSIPNEERIITIEDAAELNLNQKYVVRMETRMPNIDGKGGVRNPGPGSKCIEDET